MPVEVEPVELERPEAEPLAAPEAQPAPEAEQKLPNLALPTLAIVGRPNVGKSTLYNRIVGGRDAVIDSQPGVTRDRKVGEATWNGQKFNVIDTGGWLAKDRIGLLVGTQIDETINAEAQASEADLAGKISRQSENAMAAADVALLVVDVTVGVTEDDARVAGLLLRLDIPTVVAANKVDSEARDHEIWEFQKLGLGEPRRLSALHGRQVADLLDHVVGLLADLPQRELAPQPRPPDQLDQSAQPESPDQPSPPDQIAAVAVVGRPNVGKSTLFNRLIGDDRAIVHDMPGTTRDAVDTVVDTDLGPIKFVDTAGLRRKSRVNEDTEYYSNLRALRSMETADVALLVIDATAGVTHQDQRLAERIDAVGSPLLVVLNKWELLDHEEREDVIRQIGDRLHFVGAAPVMRISALTGRGVHKLLPAIEEAVAAYETRIPTRKVNDAIRKAQSQQPAPRGIRVLYATQGATHPPTFTLFANRELPGSYMRYLENFLSDEFGLGATPIKLRVRRR